MELHFLRSSFLSLVVLVSLLCLSSPVVSALEECFFPAIFNFGDSNSDTGGLSAAFGQAPPPNGETYFKTPSGRYSDGRLIIDFIAVSFGFPFLSAYLDVVGTNFTHGANFATAGSTIKPPNSSFTQSGFSPVSLNFQYLQYSVFEIRSQKARKREKIFEQLLPKEEVFGRALYTLDIGQNDLTYGFLGGMSTAQVKAYLPDRVKLYINTVKNIHLQGGKSFWIHNTGPIGCLPFILSTQLITADQIDSVGCASPYNEVAQDFNLQLKEAVSQLRKDYPSAAFTYVDVYSIKYSLISEANKHGFTYPLRACCGHGGKYNYNSSIPCGGTTTVNGTQILLGASCKDPSVVINWDGIHYTEAANKFVFDRIANGSYSDPPRPLKMACHK